MENTQNNTNSIIIVGAGAAGLATALKLKQSSSNINVQILEASDIYGGRVRQNQDWTDYALEMGGENLFLSESWYGKQLKNIKNLEWNSDEKLDDYIQNPDTNQMEVFVDSKLEQEIGEVQDEIMQFFDNNLALEEQGKDFQDIPMEQLINQGGFMKNNDNIHLYKTFFGSQFGSEINKVSVYGIAKNNVAYSELGEDSCFYSFKGKTHYEIFGEIFKEVLPLVQYKTAIQEINYIGQKVVLTSQDGKKFEGDKVVVCVPVSQLQNNSIKFVPQLEEHTIKALNNIKMDYCVKFHLKFSEQFWYPYTKDVIIKGRINYLWDSSSQRSNTKKEHILSGLVFGEDAAKFKAKKQEYVDEILENLSKGYQKNVKQLYIDCLELDWGEEKYIQGGYTYPSLNENNSRDTIKFPVSQKIFFAGEYVNSDFYGSISGAIDSGIEVADDILQISKK